MRKIFGIFTILILVSTSFSLQIDQKTVLDTEKDIIGYNTNFNSIFTTTKNKFYATSPPRNWTKNPEPILSKSIDSNEKAVVIGTRVSENAVKMLNISSGDTIAEIPLSNYVDNTGMYESNNSTFIAGSSLNAFKIHNIENRETFNKNSGGYSRSVPNKERDIDRDGEEEIIIGGSSRYKKANLEVRELDGDLEFQSNSKGDLVGGLFYQRKVIEFLFRKGKISLMYPNGSILWSKNLDGFSRPVTTESHIVLSNNGELVFLNEEGETVKKFGIGALQNLIHLKDHNFIAGTKNDQTVFVDLETGEVYNKNISGVQGFDTTDFDQDRTNELVVVKDRSVDLIQVGKERETIDSDTVLYGTDSESVLKAVSLNMTVFVGDETAVPERYDNYSRASNADFSSLTQNKEKYYIDSREKAVYIAPIAAKNGAVLTFEEENADRDFSNYSVDELKEKFIQEFKPHHVAVGDLDSETGLLSSYMAVKQGSVPIDNYNGVILRDEIKKTFDQIGENRKTVFQGRYISLLEAPSVQKSDPVDEGFFSDPEDGDSYRTDLEYGDLDSDSLLEAGVGRYPDNLSLSSRIFHRSQERELGDKATVASEYLHASWPVILSTGGGGLRYGSRMEKVFEEEGYETTHLVEYRADPVKFLLSLTPVEISSFLGEVEDVGEIIQKFVSESAANAVENSLIIIKVLNYTQQLMEMYFEFEWSTYEFNLERGLDRMEELDLDPSSDKKGSIQKSIMKLLYAFVWPERHPNLNETSLQNKIQNSDIVYYQGIGNEKKWTLPDNTTGYSGENSFTLEKVPEMNKTIIWDSSNLAGTRNAEMRQSFLKNGASSYLGYSSVNYPAYSSLTGYNFFQHRKTLGNSLKASINQMKTTDFIYSPTTVHKTGIREKMFDSLRLYGNPEMPKDPVKLQQFEIRKSCSEETCTLKVSIDTPQRVVEHGGRKALKSNSSNYLLEPGASITPLYSFSYRLPGGSEVVKKKEKLETQSHENLKFEKFHPITSGGKTFNVSERNITVRKSRLSVDRNRITYVVSGYSQNRTVDQADLNITYKPPATVKPETRNRSFRAEIHSDNSFEGELIYRIDNETGSKKVEIDRGENTVNLDNLSYGRHQVELVLTDETDILSRTNELVRVGKPLEVTGFSPDIRRGSTRTVTAVVSNPNSFPVEKKLRIKTSGKLELGMLEKQDRRVDLSPNQTEKLNWRLLGIKTGNTSFSVAGETTELEVRRPTSSERSVSAENILERLSSPTSEITLEISDQEAKAIWETEYGSLTWIRNSSASKSMLETPEFRAVKVVNPQSEVAKVETGSGRYIKKSGSTAELGDINNPGRRIDLLEREVEKLENYLSRRETSGFQRS